MRTTAYSRTATTWTDDVTGKTVTPWFDVASGFYLTPEEVTARGLPVAPADDAPTSPHPYGGHLPAVVVVHDMPDVVRVAVTLRHDSGRHTITTPVVLPTDPDQARHQAITQVCAAEGAPRRAVLSAVIVTD